MHNKNAEEMLNEVFSGNVLTEVYCHFEAKFESDDPGDAKMVDCFRACVAILNCAGKVDEAKVDGLRSRIVDELSGAGGAPSTRRARADLSPNVALLCAWGMTGDVARCLASSVAQYFAGGAADEADAGSARRSGASGKRKQRGEEQAAADETPRLPNLDIDVFLGILGHILKGSYPGSVLARESILKVETAFDALASALQTAKSAAERMIKPRIVSFYKRFSLLNICSMHLYLIPLCILHFRTMSK